MLYALEFCAFLASDLRHVLFAIRNRRNVLVREKPDSWHGNLVTDITVTTRCPQLLLQTLNAVVRWFSMLNRFGYTFSSVN